MKNLKFNQETDNLIYTDVEENVINFMTAMIETADKISIINWDKFRDYCYDFGMNNAPNILTIPKPVIDRCIIEAKKRVNHQGDLKYI